MILTSDKIPADSELTSDICIIGAGAAGITLALELAETNLDIIVLEAGKTDSSGNSLPLYRGSVNDRHRHLPLDQARYRQLGGTTSMWGGRCIPFDPQDLELRRFVPDAAWPLTHDELVPYYRRAHEYCQCGRYEYSLKQAIPDAPAEMIPGFTDGRVITSTIERWSPPTHFGKVYGGRLKDASNLRVILQAIVTEMDYSEDGGQIASVRVKTQRGRDFRVKANTFILSGGGFEVTRLLLSSNKIHAKGIGNHSDWLGRCYMPHIHGSIAKVTFNPELDIVFGYEQDSDGIYCRRRLCLAADTQKQLKILNQYFLLDRPLIGDPKHGDALLSLAFIAKLLKNRGGDNQDIDIGRGKFGIYWAHLKNVLTGSAGLVTVLPQFSRKRFLQKRRIPSLLQKPRNNSFSLYFQAEQAPNPESRLSLSDEKDRFGIPSLHVDFKVSELDKESIYRAHKVIQEEFEQQGCGELTFNSPDPMQDIDNCHAVMGHHIGMTRMSADPQHGVVDENCKIHHVDNLYLASSSVFPSSSQANPVLTIVALAVRLADHLKEVSSAKRQGG